MKKTLTTLIVGLFVLGFSSLAFGDDIWTLDFEISGGYSTSITEFSDGGSDFFTRTDGSNIGSGFVVTNIQGSWYFAAQDIDGEGAPLPVTLTIDNIDISGYSDLSFYVFLAEDDASDGAEDWDDADYVHIDYDIDNTGSFSNLLWIEGSGETNTAPRIDTNFDGTGDGSEITSTFTEYSANIPSTGSTIDIKVTFNLDAGDEDIALDVLRLVGIPPGGVADPTDFTATPFSISRIDLSWTKNGSNDDVMVAWNSSDIFGTPVDGTSYSEGDPISGGGIVLYNGSGTSYSHTPLTSNTQYFYKAWSVDGSLNYSSGVTANATTYKEEPTNHVIDFTATADGWSKINLSWTENDGLVVPDGYLIKASTSDNVTAPTDGIPVADNPTIGDNSGAINLSHGTTTYQWAGLNAESTYYFKIYPYTNSGSAIDYKTDGTVPSANATTEAMPEIPNLMLSEIADPSDSSNAKFVELYNYSGSVIDFSEQTWYLCRQANGNPEPSGWGDVRLTGSISSGSTYIVAYSETEFEAAFGVPPDLYHGNISGNGNDGYFLYYGGDHSSGTLVDAYGVIDQDGSGQPWEYTDGHAVRNASATEPNATWTASEWTIEPATVAECTPYVSTLPVTLSTFTATYVSTEQIVRLYWRTESEADNIGWYVYRNTEKDFANAMRLNTELIRGYGTTSEPHNYTFEDEMIAGAMHGETYWYWIESMDLSGRPEVYGPEKVIISSPPDEPGDTPEAPLRYGLYQNTPNPLVQGEVELSFCLPQSSHVELNVYNIRGELVKQVYSGFATGGERIARSWDGRDAYGNLQPSGIYLYQLKVNGKVSETKKMIILR